MEKATSKPPSTFGVGLSREREVLSLFPKKHGPVRSHFCTRRKPAVPTGARNAKARASLSSARITSDSSTSRCGNGRDRTDYNSTCTSYFESSGAESGQYGRESWHYGAILATEETELGGPSFQLICAQGGGRAEGVGGTGGAGGGRRTRLVSADEENGEGGGEGSSGDDSSSSDGIGESASVADITECLDCIGDVSQTLRRIGSSS